LALVASKPGGKGRNANKTSERALPSMDTLQCRTSTQVVDGSVCICTTDYTTFALKLDPGSGFQTFKKQMVGHISVGHILMQKWGNFTCKCTPFTYNLALGCRVLTERGNKSLQNRHDLLHTDCPGSAKIVTAVSH